MAEARNTPIRIYSQPEPEINSADGVSFYLYWNNHSDKAIKYIHFYVTPYNRVNDPLKCDITGDSNVDCYETGPFYKVSDKTDWEAETYVLSTTDTAEDGTVTPALNGIHDGKSYRMNYAYTDIEEFIPDIPITPARYDNVFMRHYWDSLRWSLSTWTVRPRPSPARSCRSVSIEQCPCFPDDKEVSAVPLCIGYAPCKV